MFSKNILIFLKKCNESSRIYNCGMPLQQKSPKVYFLKGTKKVCQVSSGNKTQITILGCASTTG